MRDAANCRVVNKQSLVVHATWQDKYELDGSIHVDGYNAEFGLVRLNVVDETHRPNIVFLTADMCEELGVTMLYEARRLRGELDGQ